MATVNEMGLIFPIYVIITLSSPCSKSKAPGPSVVPAANEYPIAAGHVCTTSVVPPRSRVTSSLEKSTYE